MTTTKQDETCCPATYSSAYGRDQYSIVQRTRKGRKHFVAEWLPTRCRKSFATKREATAFVKDHERRSASNRSKVRGAGQ